MDSCPNDQERGALAFAFEGAPIIIPKRKKAIIQPGLALEQGAPTLGEGYSLFEVIAVIESGPAKYLMRGSSFDRF